MKRRILESVVPRVVDSDGRVVNLTERNQRAYRHRSLRCTECSSENAFDELPHYCRTCGQSDTFTLLPDRGTWWDQPRVEDARVLLLGCGAVGNEVAKNLALCGVRRFTLVDFDRVEASNRARCALFNEHTLDGEASQPKVEVLARGIRSIEPLAEVEALELGIRDMLSVRLRRRFIETHSIPDGDLPALAQRHDVCVVGTDGISTVAHANKWMYPFVPLIRAAMSSNAQRCEVTVSLPRVTGCLICHEVGGLLMETFSDGMPDWRALYERTGEACGIAAEGAGAISFAHTTALVGSIATTQALLILKGFSGFRDSGFEDWPHPLPVPLWGQRFGASPAHPEHVDVSYPRFDVDPDGAPMCPQCRALWLGGAVLEYDFAPVDAPRKCPRFDRPDARPKRTFAIGTSR